MKPRRRAVSRREDALQCIVEDPGPVVGKGKGEIFRAFFERNLQRPPAGHGFSGISVYAETIFVRLLLFTVGLGCLTGFAIGTVLTLRLFVPRLATPGWATTVSFGMLIILVQAFSVTLSSILMLLNNRVQRLVIPIRAYAVYIDHRQRLLDPALRIHTQLEAKSA